MNAVPWISLACAVIALVGAIVAMLRPSGPVPRWWAEAREEAKAHQRRADETLSDLERLRRKLLQIERRGAAKAEGAAAPPANGGPEPLSDEEIRARVAGRMGW